MLVTTARLALIDLPRPELPAALYPARIARLRERAEQRG
jgi:hypothetical protein